MLFEDAAATSCDAGPRKTPRCTPCFTPGTLITTQRGELPVEVISAGDRVVTRDNGIQTVRWVGKTQMFLHDFQSEPHLLPVFIQQGSLGKGLPERDMMVSPNHRMLVSNDRTALYFDEHEVLVAAKHLLGLPGIAVAEDLAEVTYVHFLCDQHEVVFANGAPTESLYAGPMTLRALGEAAVAEIMQIFPDLAQLDSFRLSPARPLVRGSDGRHMAARHLKNRMDWLAD